MAKVKPVIERAPQEKHGLFWRAGNAVSTRLDRTRTTKKFIAAAAITNIMFAAALGAAVHIKETSTASVEAGRSHKNPQSISDIITREEVSATHSTPKRHKKLAL